MQRPCAGTAYLYSQPYHYACRVEIHFITVFNYAYTSDHDEALLDRSAGCDCEVDCASSRFSLHQQGFCLGLALAGP